MNFHEAPIIYPGPISLNVMDLAQSVHYYETIIGMTLIEQKERRAVLGTKLRKPLVILEHPENIEPKEMHKTGLYHFALLLPKRSDLADIVYHFIEKGIRVASADHLVSEALYLNDPEGNGIEIYVDRPSEGWHWENERVDMATEPLHFDDLMKEGIAGRWDGLPDETIMGHIHLHVGQLKPVREFYEALGFQVTQALPSALFMAHKKYHHHVAFNLWNGENIEAPAKNSVGLQSYTFIYPNEATLVEAVDKVRKFQLEITDFEDGVQLVDPAGNRLIVHC